MSQSKSYHHGNLRQALLDTALEQLQSCSIEKLSLRAVAKQVGVSQTAVYRHFSDKQGLLAALAEEGFNELFAQCSQAVQPHHRAPEAMQASGLAYIRFAAANPQRYKLMFGNSLPERQRHPDLEDSGCRAFGMIVSLIELGVSQGDFIEGDIQQLSRSAWAMVHGLSSLVIDNFIKAESEQELYQQLETSLSVITRGLSSPA